MPTSARVHTSPFTDDTALLSVHENPKKASILLQDYVSELENWLKLWKIKVNEQECEYLTFILRWDNVHLFKLINGQ